MDKFHIKGQSAIEFMALAGVLLLLFMMIAGISASRIESLNNQKEIIYGEDLVIKIQKEINLAARSLDGYSRTFTIPQKLGSFNYTLSIDGTRLSIDTPRQSFSRDIPGVIGNIQKDINRINKTGGVIYLN